MTENLEKTVAVDGPAVNEGEREPRPRFPQARFRLGLATDRAARA
ncbi:MAG: hypothetical protein ACT4P2_00415 [Pseudomonadota bacterium]